MGRDYEAAVMTAGFLLHPRDHPERHGLDGRTPDEIVAPAPRAFLVVPLVGAFLIDLANSAIITTFANFLRR